MAARCAVERGEALPGEPRLALDPPARHESVRNDPRIYERHAADWWDTRSPVFRSLHEVNRLRLELVRAWLGPRLAGACVVDLGCGGGLLAAPLAELGARVLGVDLSQQSLLAARGSPGAGVKRFVRGDMLRLPLRSGCARIVLLADALEHVEDAARCLREAARILAPGGHLYVNTLNRTWRARLLAVELAERIGMIPRGTHDPRLFVRPDELERMAAAAGLRLLRLQGEAPRLAATLRKRAIVLRPCASLAVGYSALLERAPA